MCSLVAAYSDSESEETETNDNSRKTEGEAEPKILASKQDDSQNPTPKDNIEYDDDEYVSSGAVVNPFGTFGEPVDDDDDDDDESEDEDEVEELSEATDLK